MISDVVAVACDNFLILNANYILKMSSRNLHPLACRLPRAEREAVREYALLHGLSVSAVIKEALRRQLYGVHPGVNMPSNHDVENGKLEPQLPTAEPRLQTLAEAFAERCTPAPLRAAGGKRGWVESDSVQRYVQQIPKRKQLADELRPQLMPVRNFKRGFRDWFP